MGIIDYLTHAWSIFPKHSNDIEPEIKYLSVDDVRALPPNNSIPVRFNNRSGLISTLYNRIAMDVSAIQFMHVKLDPENEMQHNITSSLQRIFDVEANIDQSSTDFFHDLVYSLFDEGVVAAVPIEADLDPHDTAMFNIKSMRVGKILEWYPTKVKVRVYNERKGNFSDIVVEKKFTAIIENPLANVIGPDNQTLSRLLNKLSLLDKQDMEFINNKLNMIVQLPYPVRSDIKKNEAEERTKNLENQLTTSKYGIAYSGVEEKIIQLNRPINNGLLDEIKFLFDQLLNQLGLTPKVFDGTASSTEMQSYHTRIVDRIAQRIAEEFQRKFITKTAYTQGHRITTYNDPFKLVPTEQLATIGDTLLRNSILTPNEFRAIIGYGPSTNPMADQLYNRNIADTNQTVSLGEDPSLEDPNQNGYEQPQEEYYE